jgi:hypothetical protein
MQRAGTPIEVAQAAQFLLFGPEFLTGVVLPWTGEGSCAESLKDEKLPRFILLDRCLLIATAPGTK